MKSVLTRLRRAASAFVRDGDEVELTVQKAIQPEDIDILIGSLFDMLKEEAPESGAMCISLENGALIIAAEDIGSATRVVQQYSDTIMDEIAEDFGYYGGLIEA